MIVKGSILMCPLSLWHPGEVILNWSSCYSQARNFASSQNYQFCVYRAKNTAVVKTKRDARFKVLLPWLSASCRYNDGWSKKKYEPLLLYLLWIVFVAFLQFRTNWENNPPPPTVTPVALIWRFIQNLYALLTYRPDLNSMNMLQLHSLIAGIKYLTIQHIWRMHQHFLTDLKTWLPWIWSHTADWDFHVILMWNIGCFTYSCFSCTSSTAAFLQSNQMADKLQ